MHALFEAEVQGKKKPFFLLFFLCVLCVLFKAEDGEGGVIVATGDQSRREALLFAAKNVLPSVAKVQLRCMHARMHRNCRRL